MESRNAEFLRWSASLKLWQQDALRRLATSATLSEQDINESMSLLCNEHGAKSTDAGLIAVPLSASDIASYSDGKKVRIKKIDNIRNANKLHDKAEIAFCPSSLTVVYGGNGSGKSGFSRIIRAACRSRVSATTGKTPPVLSDVHLSTGFESPSADIHIEVDGDDKVVRWIDQIPSDNDLKQIAVFDSSAASMYVDDSAHISYLPFNIDLFYRLNTLCDTLKDRITRKLNSYSNCLNDISLDLNPASEAAKFLSNITYKTTQSEIDAASAWNDSHARRLGEVSTLVGTSSSSKADLDSLLKWLNGVISRVAALANAVSFDAVEKHRRLQSEAEQTRKTAQALANGTFEGDPLDGVGNQTWKALFDAARLYSIRHAYPDKDFPYTDSGSHCVLCQQPLASEAVQRFERFDKFVGGQLAKAADAADEAVRLSRAEFAAAALNPTADFADRVKQIATRDNDAAKALMQWVEGYKLRHESILLSIERVEWTNVPEIHTENLLAQLETLSHALASNLIEIGLVGDPRKHAHLIQEKSNLEGRRMLSTIPLLLRRRIADLKEINALLLCSRATVTTGITRKAGEFSESYLTPRVKQVLLEEVRALGLVHLAPAFERKPGKTSAQYRIDIGTAIKCRTSDVYSEGEQRALALAAFLTEVNLSSKTAPIVIDDPVSSLDIERSLNVAQRLALEAQQRQVIVFTHSLVFYHQITSAARNSEINPICVSIFRTDEFTGNVDPAGPPWDGTPVKKRVGTLRVTFDELKRLHQTSPQDYRMSVKALYGRLRDTWERLVEEKLFQGVISRFSEPIGTLRLISVDVTDDVYRRIEQGMTKSSTFSHDNSAGSNVQIPAPQEILEDIKFLTETVTLIDTVSESARARRKQASR